MPISESELNAPFTQPDPAANDPALEGEALQRLAQDAPPATHEAFQYKVAYPQYDLDYIQQNLGDFRRQAQVEGVNWQQIASQHPTLAKYIRDPDRSNLALQNTALLSEWEKKMGVDLRPIKANYARLNDAMTAGLGWTMDKLNATVAEVADWATDKIASATGLEKSGYFAANAKYWNDRAKVYEPFAPWKKDYYGNTFRDSWKITKVLHEEIIGGMADMAPMLLLATASGGGSALGMPARTAAEGAAKALAQTRGLMAFNTLYTVPRMYEAAKAETGSVGAAAGLTALGAPVVGKLMAWTPLGSAAGHVINSSIEQGMARLSAEISPGAFKMARMWTAKVGLDVAAGQLALGAQHAAEVMVQESAREIGGKDPDYGAPLRAFFQGVADPSMLGFHAISIAREVGRFRRARADNVRLNNAIDLLARHLTDENAPLFESFARDVAQDGDSHVYVPMDRFHAAVDALPGDKGAHDAKYVYTVLQGVHDMETNTRAESEYDRLVSTNAEHIKVPIENIHLLKKLGLEDLVRKHGTLDPDLPGGDDLQKIAKQYADEFEKASGIDPEKISEEDKPLWDALKSFTSSDEGTAKQMLATVQALRTQHPELTPAQIFDAVWGKGGVFGEPTPEKTQATPVEDLITPAEAPFNYEGFGPIFGDEAAAKEALAKDAQEARDTSRERLREALKASNRKFLPEERARAQDRARLDLQNDRAQRALHWFATGTLWNGEPEAVARLAQPPVNLEEPRGLLDAAQERLKASIDPVLAAVAKQAERMPLLMRKVEEITKQVQERQADVAERLSNLTLAMKLQKDIDLDRGFSWEGSHENLRKAQEEYQAKQQELVDRLSNTNVTISIDELQKLRDQTERSVVEYTKEALKDIHMRERELQAELRRAEESKNGLHALDVKRWLEAIRTERATWEHFGEEKLGAMQDRIDRLRERGLSDQKAVREELKAQEMETRRSVVELAGALPRVMQDYVRKMHEELSAREAQLKKELIVARESKNAELEQSVKKEIEKTQRWKRTLDREGTREKLASLTPKLKKLYEQGLADRAEIKQALEEQTQALQARKQDLADWGDIEATNAQMQGALSRIVRFKGYIEQARRDAEFLFKKQYSYELAADRLEKAHKKLDDATAERDLVQKEMLDHPEYARYPARIEDLKTQVTAAEKALRDAEFMKRREGQPRKLLRSEVEATIPGATETIRKDALTDDWREAVSIEGAASALDFRGQEPERALVNALRNARSQSEFVRQMADLRLKEAFGGDLFENPQDLLMSIFDSIHNEKTAATLLRIHNAVAKQLDPISVAKSKLTPEAWEEVAQRILDHNIIKDTKPEIFARRAASNVKRALEAVEKSKPATRDYLERAILNHYLYKLARELHSDLGPAYARMVRDGGRAKQRAWLGAADPDKADGTKGLYLTAHDAALRAVGALSRPEGYVPDASIVAKTVERIKDNQHDAWFTNLTWDPAVVQQVITEGKRWGELQPEEAQQVHDFVTNLQTIAKNAVGESQAIKRQGIEDMRAGIIDYLRQGAKGEGPRQPVVFQRELDRQREEQKKGILARTTNRIGEWLGWTSDASIYPWNRASEVGPIGEMIMESFREHRDERTRYLKEFFYPWREVREKLDLDPKLMQAEPDIAKDLNLRNTGAETEEPTRQWLLNLVRYWGDMDGRGRLGRAWGLSPERVSNVIAKYLTPEHLDLIQQEKNVIEQKMWPLKAADHMNKTGVRLQKSEPAEFTVRWNWLDEYGRMIPETVNPAVNGGEPLEKTYAGGYYPLHWDQRPGMSDARMGDYAVRHKLPRVPSEWTIERSKTAADAPDLGWTGMPTHMLRVAHAMAFGEWVQDASRVFLDKDVMATIAAYRGDDFARAIPRWLERVALDVSGGPDATYYATDKNTGLRMLRRGAIRSTVAFNYPIMFAHAAHPIATGEARYGTTYAVNYAAPALADVLRSYSEQMVLGRNDLVRDTRAMFSELQHRADTLRDEMQRWYLDKEIAARPPAGVRGKLRDFLSKVDEHVIEGGGMWHLRKMDEAFSTATALAKYREVLERTGNADEAIRAGNREVAETMPTYSQMEQAEILADKHSLRSVGVIWHNYYGTWRGITRDVRYEAARRPAEEYFAANGKAMPFTENLGNEAWAFGHNMAGLAIALVLGAYFKGAGPERKEGVPHWALKHSIMAPFEVLPYAGQMAEMAVDLASGKRARPVAFDNTYLSPLTHLADAAGAFGDHRQTMEDRSFKLARAGAELAGFPKPAINLGRFALHASKWWDRSPEGTAATATDLGAHVFYPYRYGRSAKYQQHNPLMDAASMMEAP